MLGSETTFTIRLAYVITIVWLVSMGLDASVESYDPPPSVHGLIMMVAGWAFGKALVKNKRDSDDK